MSRGSITWSREPCGAPGELRGQGCVLGDPLECVTNSRGLPEDLGQNPFCQLSCAAKYCHDPSVRGDLKHDNILQHEGTSINSPASFLPRDTVVGGCSQPGFLQPSRTC